MATKKSRILKRDWASFVKTFNRKHQLRRASLVVGDDIVNGKQGMPFLGINYDSEARKVEIVFGDVDPDQLRKVVMEVDVPRAFYLVEDDEALDGVRGIQIQPGPGRGKVLVMFDDDNPQSVRDQWVSDVAYRFYEKRGYVHGEDQQDWFMAEEGIKKVCEEV